MVTCVSDLIGFDTEWTQIVKDGVLELLLLLDRVCVIESNYQSSVKGTMCEIVIEKSGLRMTNVKIPSVQIRFWTCTLYETVARLTMVRAGTLSPLHSRYL